MELEVEVKKGMGKRKGNSYEIKISRILSKWYSGNFVHVEDFFWRTAGSGAKATRGKSAETSFFGDITYLPNPDALNVWIDCKDRKDITFNNILTDRFLPYVWYRDEVKKAEALGIYSRPILIIFKIYRKKENYVFFNYDEFKPLTFFEEGSPSLFIRTGTEGEVYCVLEIEEFLRNIDRGDIVNDGGGI